MKALQIMAAAALILAGGCATTSNNDEQYRLLTQQMQQLNKNLETLTKQLEKYNRQATQKPGNSIIRNLGDIKTLATIKLPQNPTDEQIIEYVQKISNATRGQNVFAPNDIQVTLLKKIGPGHLALLDPFLSESSHHLHYALPSLVGKADKKAALKHLPQVPDLIKPIVQHGWIEEAKEGFFMALQHRYNTWTACQYAKYFTKTPKDRSRLIELYETGKDTSRLYSLISTFKDIDLKKITDNAWKNHRYAQDWIKANYAKYAAMVGNLDALYDWLSILARNSYMSNNTDNNITLVMLTGQTDDIRQILSWFNKNKSKLYFDEKEKTFKVREK